MLRKVFGPAAGAVACELNLVRCSAFGPFFSDYRGYRPRRHFCQLVKSRLPRVHHVIKRQIPRAPQVLQQNHPSEIKLKRVKATRFEFDIIFENNPPTGCEFASTGCEHMRHTRRRYPPRSSHLALTGFLPRPKRPAE